MRGHARHRSGTRMASRRHRRASGRRQVRIRRAPRASGHLRAVGGRACGVGQGAPPLGRRAGESAPQERPALRHVQPRNLRFRRPPPAGAGRPARADRPAPAVLPGRLERLRHSDRQPAIRANRRRAKRGRQKEGSRRIGARGIRHRQMQRPVRAHSRGGAEPRQTRRRNPDVHRPAERLLRAEQEGVARAVRAQQRRDSAAESGQRPVRVPRKPGVQPHEPPANDHPDRRDFAPERRAQHSGHGNEQVA